MVRMKGMRCSRLWWFVLAVLVVYLGGVKLFVSGVLLPYTKLDGPWWGYPLNYLLILNLFFGLPVIVVIFGGTLFSEIMTWRDRRAQHREQSLDAADSANVKADSPLR